MAKTAISITEVPFGSELYLKALLVRHAALRAPLGLCYTPQELALDAKHRHFIACSGSDVAASVTLMQEQGVAQLRQVAVNAIYQNQGIGSQLIAYVEDQARHSGNHTAFLNSRLEVIPFYQKLGYMPHGEHLVLINLPHQRMEKKL